MPYVYQYIDSTTGLPFYIGKGTGSRKDRHLSDARKALEGHLRGRHSYCVNRIMALLNQGNEPRIEIIADGLSHEDAFKLEEHLISKYGRINLDENGILTNRAIGGLGGRGYKQTPEMIAALIERNHKQKGKSKPGLKSYIAANPDKHISFRQKGVPKSPEARANMSAGQRKAKIGAKVLTFRSPSGEITRTTEWRQFLIDHKLSYNLVRGKGQVYTKGPNAGWSLLKSEYLNR